MEIGINNPKTDSNVKAIAAGSAAGVLAGGAYKAVKPVAADSFNRSIESQKKVLDKFARFKENVNNIKKNGGTPIFTADTDGYVKAAKERITNATNPEIIAKTYTRQSEAALNNPQMADKLKNYCDNVHETAVMGTKKAFKQLNADEKVIKSGAPSKSRACKEAAEGVVSKTMESLKTAKNKTLGFMKEKGKGEKIKAAGKEFFENISQKTKTIKDGVVKFAKSENKLGTIKANKETIKKSLQKAGKAALPVLICTGAALVINKLIGKNKEE